jgi:hypothetical protein
MSTTIQTNLDIKICARAIYAILRTPKAPVFLERPVYSIEAAQSGIEFLIDFTEGWPDLQTNHLRAMERLDQELEAMELNNQRQINRWIT